VKRALFLSLVWLCAAFAAPGPTPPSDLRPRLEALSAKGSGEAAYHLGMLYHLGLDGTPRDLRKAFELFGLAAMRGDPLGAYKLGCYYAGQGGGIVEADPVLALRYKLVAAEAGYSLAQQDVAIMLLGRGEREAGISWLERAAHQGGFTPYLLLSGYYSGEVPELSGAKDAVRQYAFIILSLADHGEDLAALRSSVAKGEGSKLTAEQVAQAEAMVAGWQVERTPVTLKAAAGLGAARRLAGLP
jgi:TPR repeat protein